MVPAAGTQSRVPPGGGEKRNERRHAVLSARVCCRHQAVGFSPDPILAEVPWALGRHPFPRCGNWGSGRGKGGSGRGSWDLEAGPTLCSRHHPRVLQMGLWAQKHPGPLPPLPFPPTPPPRVHWLKVQITEPHSHILTQ